MARYLRPEVTNEGNQNVNFATDDTVFRSTTKQTDRHVKETDVEEEQGVKKYNQNEENTAGIKCVLPAARVQVATAQWEKTDVVNEDDVELHFDSTIKQSYHSAMPCTDADKQEGDIVTPNKPKQRKSVKEVDSSDGSWTEYSSSKDNTEFKGSETKQNLKQTEDIEQNKGTKEESDHYNEDDGEREKTREELDGTDVPVQSVLYEQDLQQNKLINKIDYEETEDTKAECIREKVVQYVINKNIVFIKDPERTENNEDKETKSLEKDENLLLKLLVCSTEDEADLPKSFESEMLEELEKHLENIKYDGIQIPEKQEDIISKDVVELPETRDTYEPGKHIEVHEQHKEMDSSADIYIKKKAHEQRLGEIQTAQTKSGDKTQLESVEKLPRHSRQTFEESVTCNELELKTTTVVHKNIDEIFDAPEDTMQSASSVQCFPETQNLLSFMTTETDRMSVCEFPGEPRKGPEMGSTEDLDQIIKEVTSLGSFEEIKANIYEPPILTEENSQEENTQDIQIPQDIKTPISSVELGTKQIQTLKEMAEFTLKECDELRTKLLFETTKSEIDFEEKDFMTASQADDKIFELNIETECTTMDTIIESQKNGKWDSSVEIDRKELNAEDTPDVTEANTELIRFLDPAEVMVETLDLQDTSEGYPEKLDDMKAEVRLLGETELLTTVESVEEIMNQVLKETLEMENKLMQEIELSSETFCNVEFQRPTECLQTCARQSKEERELLGDTVDRLVEMEVKAGINEAVKKQKDQHNISSLECEPTGADRGFEQLEKNTVGEILFHGNDGISEIHRPGLKRRSDDVSKDLPEVKDQKSPLLQWSTTVDLNERVMQNI